jgi:basic amino acid/polyamine antiporter, APA family
LSGTDAFAIIVGLVIGAGIFKAPAIVAANTGGEWTMLLAWLLGGAISLTGALCYAELASAYPSSGGEYHFLTRAYGKNFAFLFAWSRLAILQTGSIALLGFVLGDYLSVLMPLGNHGAAIYAALAVIALTALNIAGLQASTAVQRIMAALTVLGLLVVIVAGLGHTPPVTPVVAAVAPDPSPAFGLAMVFVLLTYGGWNESAYISAELRDVRRNMTRVLVSSILCITALYVLVNWAYANVLGLPGMAASQAITSDVMRSAVGDIGADFVTALIVLAVLDSIHVSILTGARTNYATARDFPPLRFLGTWNSNGNAPINGLLIQCGITLLLVFAGTFSRSGFEAMVHYVSPVFWLFFLSTVLSLFVLRRRDPTRARPFRVPLYPLTPLLFAAACGYMLYSSLAYTGFGSLLGAAVLCAGVPLLIFINRQSSGGGL